VWCLAAAAGQAADRKAAVEALVQPLIENGDLVGAVVGVFEDGKTQVFGFGKRAAGNAKPPDASTVLEIGSVTKVFTGLALAQMAERKMLSLDDPVRKFLPPGVVPPSKEGTGREITLLDLATQSSGLPRMPSNFRPKDPQNPYADYTPELLYEFLAKHTLIKRPEAAYLYSNLGVGLLGHALSLRAGSSYEKLIADNIATPLRMRDTCMVLSDDLRSRLAQGHDPEGQPAPNWDFTTLAGCGGLRSTAADMLRLLAANIDPPESLAAAVKMSHEIQGKTAPAPGSIALAWQVKPDGKTYWHNGGTAGYSAYVSFNAEQKTAVIVLLNIAPAGQWMDRIGAQLEAMLAGEPVEPLKIRRSVAVDPKILEAYAGTYELTPAIKATIRREGDRLFAQVTGQPEHRIYPESETEFFWRVVEAQLTFTKNEQGEVTGFVLHQGGRDVTVKRVK
jgi:D-alanyl-D-alanine-carboxypeptidase/D-alanyl-D-alanine-endopeptidase